MRSTKSEAVEARVFLSYCRKDSGVLSRIERHLSRDFVKLIVDRSEVEAGGDFVGFMERALCMSDYCVLLWSRAARESPWVEGEWHAAYARCVREKRGFLCVARLEPEEIPRLLASRMWVDLFPSLENGLDELANSLWRRDRLVTSETGRPVTAGYLDGDIVGAALGSAVADREVYLISEFLDVACPIRLPTQTPMRVLTQDMVKSLGLPKALKLGRVLIHVEYFLDVGGLELPAAATLGTVNLPDPPVVTLGVRILAPSVYKADPQDQRVWTYRGESWSIDKSATGDPTRSLHSALISKLRDLAVY